MFRGLCTGILRDTGNYTHLQHGDYRATIHHYRRVSPIPHHRRLQGLKSRSLPPRPGEHSPTATPGRLGTLEQLQEAPSPTRTKLPAATLSFSKSPMALEGPRVQLKQ